MVLARPVRQGGHQPREGGSRGASAVERGRVRAIIPARFKFMDYLRLFGVHPDSLLLHIKSQRELIRTYDSSSSDS